MYEKKPKLKQSQKNFEFLNRLDFEMQSNQRKNHTFQILNQIIKRSQTFGISEKIKRNLTTLFPFIF